VPVEAAGVRQAGHTGGQREFAKLQLRVAPLAVPVPRLHVRPRGDTNQDVVERCWITFEDGALAACIPDQDLRPVLRGAHSGRQHQFCAQMVEFEGENLTKARSAVTIQYDISAYLKFQAVQRGLKGEPAPVNRGSERKNCLFQAPARLAEALQPQGLRGVTPLGDLLGALSQDASRPASRDLRVARQGGSPAASSPCLLRAPT
jgi:hypothetical protein